MIMPRSAKVPSSTRTKSYRNEPYPTTASSMAHHSSHHHHQTTRPSQIPGPLTTQTNERSSAAWSTEDDNLLMRCRTSGMNWQPIATNHFPTKTPNACRKRHERLMEKRNAESWDGLKIEDLARAYMGCRETMWRMVGEKVGEKWNIVEMKVLCTPPIVRHC